MRGLIIPKSQVDKGLKRLEGRTEDISLDIPSFPESFAALKKELLSYDWYTD